MCNLFIHFVCILLILLPVYSVDLVQGKKDDSVAKVEQLPDGGEELLPVAEKLVRHRRQPPYILSKHSSRPTKRAKPRRRIKTPKTKYGPPNYRHGDPITYYKPTSPPPHIESPPSYSLDNLQHLKFDGADFKIPPSSYESQTMDFDLYNHGDLYGAHKFPSLDYSFDGLHDSLSPGGGISSGDIGSYHVPHQKYGLPTAPQLPSISGYDPPESYISHHYQASPQQPESTSYHHTQHIPATQYGVPTAPAPVPTALDDYSIYEQKIHNIGYKQHFAEPPNPSPNVEIAYSPPAYEINTSYQAHIPAQHDDTSYQQPQQSYNDIYRAPPQQPTKYSEPHQPPPPEPQPHIPVSSYPQEHYAPPAAELPLNPNHKFPSFDFPKSSYEVPIYDPIPFEASTKEEHESYPPIIEQGGNSGIHNTHNDPPLHSVDAAPAGSSVNQRQKRKRLKPRGPTAVSPKHTLDVPELQHAFESTHYNGGQDADVNESHHIEQKRKFARFEPSTATTTTQATPTTTIYPLRGGSWSPMRGRTTTTGLAFLPTIVTSTPATQSRTTQNNNNRYRGSTRYHRIYTTTTESSFPNTANVAGSAVSVQQSHSQSYYAGTIASPTYYQHQHQFNVPHHTRGFRPTRPSAHGSSGGESTVPKRTTKSVFDTTYFKSPHTDKDIERKLHVLHQTLPKNHKLF